MKWPFQRRSASTDHVGVYEQMLERIFDAQAAGRLAPDALSSSTLDLVEMISAGALHLNEVDNWAAMLPVEVRQEIEPLLDEVREQVSPGSVGQRKFAAQLQGAHNFLGLVEEGAAARRDGTSATFKSTGDLLGLVGEVKADVGMLRQQIAQLPEDLRPAAEAELAGLQERLAAVQAAAFPLPARPELSEGPAALTPATPAAGISPRL